MTHLPNDKSLIGGFNCIPYYYVHVIAINNVYVLALAVPKAPKLVGVTCRRYRAVVEWHPMVEQRAPILYFIVEYNTSFTPDIWVIDYNFIPADDLSFQVN